MTALCNAQSRNYSASPTVERGRFANHQLKAEERATVRKDKNTYSAIRDLPSRAQALLSREIAFVPDPAFKNPSIVSQLRHELESLVVEDNTPQAADNRTSRAGSKQLYRTPLLKPEEERNNFRWMNFAKFLANSLRSRLCLQNPKAEQIEKIERLLGLAANLRNRIVCANTRLVASIAKRFAEDDSRFDDLISDGYLVLLRAVDKFDASRGFRFSTYATHAIRREFYHSLYRRKGNAVNLGDDAERAAAVDSLPEDESQESQLEQFRRYQWILNYIDSEFDARDQQILSLRFGVADDSAPQTLAKIGAKLGLSKERVRQLQIRAIEQLREAACNEYSDVSENSHDSA